MKFKTRKDIETPSSFAFKTLANPEIWIAAFQNKDVRISRTDSRLQLEPGCTWQLSFSFRRKPRHLTITLDHIIEPHILNFTVSGDSFEIPVEIELQPLTQQRTRTGFEIDLKARNLSGRLILQSMKLARRKIEQKYDTNIGNLCNTIEDRYYSSPER